MLSLSHTSEQVYVESENSNFIAHRLARLLRLPTADIRKDVRTIAAYRRIVADFQNDPDDARGAVAAFNEQEVGGVFVLGPGNSCDFDFRSEFVGQEPEMPMLIVRCAPAHVDPCQLQLLLC